jgi:type IV pilus assembly protein PilC
MLLKFKAKKISGIDVEGEREAPDKFALARELRAEGLTLVAVHEQVSTKDTKWFTFTTSVGLKHKIVFANNLGAMITAGLSLSRALSIMERQTGHKYFKKVLSAISEKISKGDSLYDALSSFPDVFPPVFTAMVHAGEESGKLPQSLKVVSDQLSKAYELRRKLKGAMIYPTIIVTLIVIIAALMMIFLVPTLTATFKELGVELPLSTRLVIGVSEFLNHHILLAILGVLVSVTAVVGGLRTKSGGRLFDTILLRLPVIGNIVRAANSAVTMRTIASLVVSGVSMIESLKITERVLQNSYYKEVMAKAADSIQQGVNLSTIFKQEGKLYPLLVGEMAEVGEETGNLSQMLTNGAEFYEAEVDQATKNLSTIIEPALMVFIGIAVGFFALSMIGPMYSLSDAI